MSGVALKYAYRETCFSDADFATSPNVGWPKNWPEAFSERSLMRISITIAASATLLTAANCQAEDSKACRMKATQSLPTISGLVIKKTRTRPVPAAILATWQGQTRPIIVDLDTAAAGAEETYSYMCVITKGSAYVRRVMS
jgi:hypothetical protein